MQSFALLGSGVRFTEGPGDWGMPRMIWRTFKSSLSMTHKRHLKGRADSIDPGWIQGTRSFTLGKLQDQLFFWKWWWHWWEKEEAGSVLSLWACNHVFFTYPCPRNMGSKPAWRNYRKTFTPLVYNIKNGVIIPLVLNLTGIIKIEKTIFGWKKATKHSSGLKSKSVLKEKPWKCKQGISPAQLNKRSEEEKLCEIILHPEFNLHSNSIYRWMNDGNQLRANKLQSPSLLLCEKIPSQHSKYSLKIALWAQSFLYNNFVFMQFQSVKDALNCMITYKENSILFEGHTCILTFQCWPSTRRYALKNVFKQREAFLCLFSILILDLKMPCLVSSKSIIIYMHILMITNLLIILDLKESRNMSGAI